MWSSRALNESVLLLYAGVRGSSAPLRPSAAKDALSVYVQGQCQLSVCQVQSYNKSVSSFLYGGPNYFLCVG